MTHNSTPKPLSEKPWLKKLPSGKRGDLVRVEGRIVDYQTEPCEVGDAKPLTRVLLEFDSVEQGQHETPEDPNEPHRLECPAPVPLEFDSPLRQRLARLLYDLSDRISDDHEADYKRCELEWLSDADSVLRLLTPVPLAEDEALIAEALDDDAVSWPLRKEGLVRQVVERLSLRSGQLAKARSFIVRILVECGPGSHPGRTPEEAADEIIEGNK